MPCPCGMHLVHYWEAWIWCLHHIKGALPTGSPHNPRGQGMWYPTIPSSYWECDPQLWVSLKSPWKWVTMAPERHMAQHLQNLVFGFKMVGSYWKFPPKTDSWSSKTPPTPLLGHLGPKVGVVRVGGVNVVLSESLMLKKNYVCSKRWLTWFKFPAGL